MQVSQNAGKPRIEDVSQSQANPSGELALTRRNLLGIAMSVSGLATGLAVMGASLELLPDLRGKDFLVLPEAAKAAIRKKEETAKEVGYAGSAVGAAMIFAGLLIGITGDKKNR